MVVGGLIKIGHSVGYTIGVIQSIENNRDVLRLRGLVHSNGGTYYPATSWHTINGSYQYAVEDAVRAQNSEPYALGMAEAILAVEALMLTVQKEKAPYMVTDLEDAMAASTFCLSQNPRSHAKEDLVLASMIKSEFGVTKVASVSSEAMEDVGAIQALKDAVGDSLEFVRPLNEGGLYRGYAYGCPVCIVADSPVDMVYCREEDAAILFGKR
jgi:hypothetical protein